MAPPFVVHIGAWHYNVESRFRCDGNYIYICEVFLQFIIFLQIVVRTPPMYRTNERVSCNGPSMYKSDWHRIPTLWSGFRCLFGEKLKKLSPMKSWWKSSRCTRSVLDSTSFGSPRQKLKTILWDLLVTCKPHDKLHFAVPIFDFSQASFVLMKQNDAFRRTAKLCRGTCVRLGGSKL